MGSIATDPQKRRGPNVENRDGERRATLEASATKPETASSLKLKLKSRPAPAGWQEKKPDPERDLGGGFFKAAVGCAV